MLSINIKYFGMLEEAVNKESEVISVNDSVTVDGLKLVILQKYPKLKKMDFQVACNLTIAGGDDVINDNDQVALLPPFAGG